MSPRPSTDPIRVHAPGRVNLIGEHTDYNGGLALPFAIDRGVTVTAVPTGGEGVTTEVRGAQPFLRGALGELDAAGIAPPGARIEVDGDLPVGAGLSSSAALSAALVLALLALADAPEPDRLAVARLCSRIENRWVGAHTGLLDQLAVLLSPPGGALLIDFDTLATAPQPLDLAGWRLALIDSGARHRHAEAGYNDRRAECEAARTALGIASLRRAPAETGLEPPLDRRVRHVVAENARVGHTVEALAAGDLPRVGELLDTSHASLRDDFEVSVPEVERARDRAKAAGAAGARIMGGGFGGSVIALFAPDATPPDEATPVAPASAARMLSRVGSRP